MYKSSKEFRTDGVRLRYYAPLYKVFHRRGSQIFLGGTFGEFENGFR